MKKLIAWLVFSALILSLANSVLAESQTHHLLWNIEYGKSANEVKKLVEEGRGIVCWSEHLEKSKINPFDYATINSMNDEDIGLFGYPFHFYYTDFGLGTTRGRFELTIDRHDSWDERCEACNTVLHGLIDKYGKPDLVRVELYSNGKTAWDNKSVESYHEIYEVPADTIESFSPDDSLANWQYSTDATELTLWVRFFNIQFKARYNNEQLDDSSIVVQFKYDEFNLPDIVFESREAKATPAPMDQYGF